MKKNLCWAIIPLIVSVFVVLFTNAAGPYWLSPNGDPAYVYFFNFLYLVGKLPLIQMYHPGLTLDVLGVLTFRLFHPFLSPQDLFLTVIQNPEFYLHVLHGFLVFMYVVSLWFLGWYAYRKSHDIFFALLVQLSSLLVLAVPSIYGYAILPVMAHVKAETLLVTATNLLMVGLVKLYWDKNTRSSMLLALYLGCVCALGLFTKYTFILCLFLPLFLFRGWASRCWFLLSFIVVGYIFYNVETDPYHRILLWVRDLIFQSGSPGALSGKFIVLTDFISSLKLLVEQNAFVFLTAALALIIGLWKRDKFVFLISGAVLVQFPLVARHPNPHYMISAVGLSGLVFALLYDKFRNRLPSPFVGMFIILFILVNAGGLIQYLKNVSEENTAIFKYSQSISADYPGYVVCPYYKSSSLVFNLAAWTNGMNTFYNKLLKEKYPDYYYYDTNARDFKDFLSRWVPLSEIRSGHKGVLLYGSAVGEDFFKPYTIVHEIEHTPQGEALYEVIAEQSPHAGEYMQYSVMLFSQGQYKQALEYAVYAKQLGFPDDITGYLNQIIARIKNGAN